MTVMDLLNETHDPALQSWVDYANQPRCDFPIQNLPFGVFRPAGSREAFRAGVAIGDQILDLQQLHHSDLSKGALITGEAAKALAACQGDTLNAFMALGQPAWSALRLTLSRLLRKGAAEESRLKACLFPQTDAEYKLPATIGDYTDFYTSIHHATRVGSLFRPDNPLLPNYKWVPIGYHGRSSSIEISGQQFHRPLGQTKAPDAEVPSLGPCKRLDYELELGIYIGGFLSDPKGIGLDVVMGCFLLAILLGGEKNLRMVVIWTIAGVSSLMAYWYLPENSHVIVGALAGGFAGLFLKEVKS